MTKNALTVTAAVLLILYSVLNFAAAYGQFLKADMLSGLVSIADSTGRGVAGLHDRTVGSKSTDPRVQQQGDRLRSDTAELKRAGTEQATVLYAIAVLILVVAVTEVVAAIGTFAGKRWAITALFLAGIGGVLVELQDTYEDGMDVWKVVLFAVNAIVLYAAFAARADHPQATTPEHR